MNIKLPKSNSSLIENITFDIKKGDVFTLIGESGSGKTTVLSAIVGKFNSLYQGGQISYYGREFSGDVFVDDISYIPQNYPLFDEVSVEDNVMVSFKNSTNYYLCLYPTLNKKDINFQKDVIKNIKKLIRKEKHKKSFESLEKEIVKVFKNLNLNYEEIKSRKPNQLSGGQRQRLSIACSLLKKPKLVIMDEPFANLDSKTSLDIMDYILELKEQGISFLIATHDINVISGHEDASVLLSGRGEWISGNISDFKKNRTDEWIVSYFTPYYNKLNNDIFLYDEVSLSKTKTDIKGKVVNCKKWKDSYRVKIKCKEGEVFLISNSDMDKDKEVYLKI